MKATMLAAAIAALGFALPTAAAQKTPPPANAGPAPSRTAAPATAPPARAPARIIDIPLPPPPTLATRVPRIAWFGAGVGGFSGFKVGKGEAFHLDYGLLRTPPAWRVLALEWHLAATFSRPTGDTPLTATVIPPFSTQPVTVDAGVEKVKALLFEVVPTARVLWTVAPRVAFFADGGLGVCQTVEKYDRSEMFAGHSTRTDYVTGAVARVGIGMAADLSERWRVVFLPAAFSFQLGPKFSAYTPTLGVAYRL